MLLSFSDFSLIFSGIFEIFSWISPFPLLIPKWCQGIKPLAEEATQGKIKWQNPHRDLPSLGGLSLNSQTKP
jgi:hypothetical protein